ncbi:amino acid adenylation domain-containing protein [Micromonospora sp. M71_S20]|uniref:non-ribosomal peptide synthetase n=1 Tax=Micromonospora sp. M71_S20 TaxID=592872 RepID=UPI000F0ED268|nr:non-ribosomal peptide synthetase [Micromonospora sp. M71_S20]RLK09770.1 amino acid adenylation domain-containing protein [Micromonospora sp. M71_S20]
MPLSVQQRAVHVAQQFVSDGAGYNVAVAYRLTGALDEGRLDRALTEVVRRQPQLRVQLQEEQSVTYQVLQPAPASLLRTTDVVADDLDAHLTALCAVPFVAEDSVRLRAHLLRQHEAAALLLIVFDHLAVDAPSLPVFLDQLSRAYAGVAEPETDGPDYFSYVRWQQDFAASPAGRAAQRFWQESLDGVDPGCGIAPSTVGSAAVEPRVASIAVRLPADLDARAARIEVTPFSACMAAYTLVLQHYTRSDDVVVAFPGVDWRRPRYRHVVGLFSDMLRLRAPCLATPSLAEYVRLVQDRVMDGVEHQGVALAAAGSGGRMIQPGRPPLPAVLSFNDASFPLLALPGVVSEPVEFATRGSKAELLLSINLRGGVLTGRLDYCTNLFQATEADAIARGFETVLAQLLADADAGAPLTVRLADPETEERILTDWSVGPPAHTGPGIVEAFRACAADRPDALALVAGDRTVSYAELDRWSNLLAAEIGALSLPPGSVVALCMTRSAAFVAAVLAVLRCGHAFLPVDMEQPANRRSFLLSDAAAGAAVVTATADAPAGLPVVVAAQAPPPAGSAAPLTHVAADPAAPAYLITTSGTTGLPKTAVVPHRAILNHLRFKQHEFGLDRTDRFYFKTSPVFDASVWEYLTPLVIGAAVVVAPAHAHRDPALMHTELRTHEVSVAQFVPTLLGAMLAERSDWDCPRLRWLFCGGERLTRETAAAAAAATRARVVNLYGPSETTIDATFHVLADGPLEPDADPPIGRPVAGMRAYVLGQGGQLLPPGFPGELHVGGVGLALGYVNRDELTAKVFVPDTVSRQGGGRLYRTGDLARWCGDGDIAFLGREDGQVKVRGLRVELEGVRRVVLRFPGIVDALVAVHPRRPDALVAYAVTLDGLDAARLRAHLAGELPAELVPAYLVAIDRIPTGNTGKADPRRLPVPEVGLPVGADAQPRGVVERKLADLWARALGAAPERLPRDVPLFALGASSMTLIQVHREIRREFAVEVPVTDLFKYPTVAALAAALTERLDRAARRD